MPLHVLRLGSPESSPLSINFSLPGLYSMLCASTLSLLESQSFGTFTVRVFSPSSTETTKFA